jgi:hypothetical protein
MALKICNSFKDVGATKRAVHVFTHSPELIIIECEKLLQV